MLGSSLSLEPQCEYKTQHLVRINSANLKQIKMRIYK
jgi:hypothetical protein